MLAGMRNKRPRPEDDLPTNAHALLAAAIREACEVAEIKPEQFATNPTARMFAAAMLSHVPTGDHPYCTRNALGSNRANLIVGRDARNNTFADLRKHHPGWGERARRKAQKLLAVWDGDEREGRAA